MVWKSRDKHTFVLLHYSASVSRKEIKKENGKEIYWSDRDFFVHGWNVSLLIENNQG